SFFFAANNNLLEEVAKFRAVRRAWSKIIKERFGSDNPRAQMMRYHVQTDGFTLTEQQPLNNVVRVAIQVLSGVLGGCQSLHACSYDEALALPSEDAVQLSLRTQQIVAYESGVADTVDPLGGSYYVEKLTNEIEKGIFDYIKKIDDVGGAQEAINKGYIQREIRRSAYDYQKAVDAGEQVVVGVNMFATKGESAIEVLEIDETVEKRQVARLRKLKKERDNKKVSQILDEVRKVARSDANIMPVLIEAVKAYATVGEITDAMRDVFGVYKEPGIL
ncbi:MAG: methylmalonyl-CoA mutase family protein, partial [Dehalococcoidales bacterium]|nr:methylmalonyl-CoA mutase family protein [Dehalococcoidales bacterium]